MSSVLSLADFLEPNLALIRGDLKKIAEVHVDFYKFYIRLATKCDAFVFGRESREYLEKCIDHLENKKLTKQAIQQSRSNCLKMLRSLEDLCVNLGVEKNILTGIHKLIDQSRVDDEGKGGGTLDLLKQLKNLLNDPGETINDDNDKSENNGRVSPANSDRSSTPEREISKSSGGVEPMIQYFLSDSGIDNYYHKYNKDVKNLVFIREMNKIASKCHKLRGNSYGTLDKLFTRLNMTMPIINYTGDRVDSIDSSSVMENPEIFGGNKSVTDAVLHSCPEYLSIGPFDVYVRRTVFVYHCLVFNCNDCVTNSLEYLKLHVKFEHGIHSTFDWSCSACELIELHSTCQKSLDGALDHLAKYHSIKTTSTLSNERLLEINQNIEKGDLGEVCPKPKSDASQDAVNDLFKCPHPQCGFSTNDANVAFGHFECIPDQKVTVSCHYCSFASYSIYSLCSHIFNEHGNASYKCSYCPYRSVSKSNCVHHQRDLHPGSPRRILGIEPLPHAQYSYTCRAHNTIKPFVCNSSCDFDTMVEQKFNHHILTHPGAVVTCHYCNSYHTDDMSDLRDHLLMHGVGEYHCLYCKEAFNSIFSVQRHLHEQHSSRFPFVIICQDFESRSHSLTGKYQKVQKLDIGEECIVVLSLDSDIDVISIDVVSQIESITVDDVDHSKLQLKVFLKNKEEPLLEPEIPEVPHIEETLDLTASDDPKERVDIKPRLRVRTIEEIMVSAQEPQRNFAQNQALPDNQAGYLGIATFHSFARPEEQPMSLSEEPRIETTMPILTPAQIKKERFCGPDDQEMDCSPDDQEMGEGEPQTALEPMSEALIPAMQIKREIVEGNVIKSPKKQRPVKPSVKTEGANPPAILPINQAASDDRNEDQEAVAALILQEGTGIRGSFSDGESERQETPRKSFPTPATPRKSLPTPETPMEVDESQEVVSDVTPLPMIGKPTSHEGSPNIVALQREVAGGPEIPDIARLQTPFTEMDLSSGDNTINEVVIDPTGNSFNTPILSAASIDDVPVDFDCFVPQDTKDFPRDAAGNVIQGPRYKEPTVVDTVIISDEEDYADDVTSPMSATLVSPPPTPPTSVVKVTQSPTPPSPFRVTQSPTPPSPLRVTQSPTPPSPLRVTQSPTTPSPSKVAQSPTSPRPVMVTPASPILKFEGDKLVPVSTCGKLQRLVKVVRPAPMKPETILIVNPKTASNVRTVSKVIPNTSFRQLLGPIQAQPSPTPAVIAMPSSSQSGVSTRFRCKFCPFCSEDRLITMEHLHSHGYSFPKPNPQLRIARPPPEKSLVRAVSCPYCSDVVYEGIKSFERHHREKHSDFSEVKCFLVYNNNKMILPQLLACTFCGHFCQNEEAVWLHAQTYHSDKLANMKKPLALKCTVAMKKMVCPLYNCLDEFLDPASFKSHVNCHTQVIACKKCTYIADCVEEFQKFHLKIDVHDRVDHFYYNQSKEERANLLNVQRFSNPLYSLSTVLFKEKQPTPIVKKTTARKSTGGARFK